MTLKIMFYSAILLVAFLGYRYYHNHGKSPLQVGDKAPAFNLPDAQGNMVSLEDYRGKWLVLYFYPKDDTPGCTKEACQFRDDLQQLEKLGAKVVGVSVDDSQSHADFSKKYSLPFPLLSDSEGKVAEQYQALITLGPVKIAKRYTFLIDANGILKKSYLNVAVSKHSQEIIDDLTAMKNT